jgi:beta-barrel assembly-enhancing protease
VKPVRLLAGARPLAVCTVVLLAGCAGGAPAPAAPGAVPLASSTEAGIRMQMDRAEQEIATSGQRVRDGALERYVYGIACRVAGDFCPEMRVYVLEVPDFNASMAPNGMMVVWTGLLLRATNEAELAAVLGHETAHYTLRHSLARLERLESTVNVLSIVQLGALLGGAQPITGDLTVLAAQGYLAAFSREQESQADDAGLRLAEAAGYDPTAAARIWDGMIAEQEADKDAPRPPAFFASHPPAPDRAATLRTLAAVIQRPGAKNETGRERYAAATAAHRAAWLRAELAQRRPARTLVLLERLRAQGVAPGEVGYYTGEVYRLRGEAGDSERAIASYREALAHPDAPAETHRQLGLALRTAGRRAEAQAAFRAYLAAAPRASDRAMVESYVGQGP